MKKDPQVVFGTDKRRGIYTRNENPGPGSYSLNRSMSMKAVAISGKRVPAKTNGVPGPGQYSMEKSFLVKKREPSIVFGKGDRLEKDISSRRIVPGPG